MSGRDEFLKKFTFISKNFAKNISVYYVSDFKSSLGITYFQLDRVSQELSGYFSDFCKNSGRYIGVSLSNYCYLPCIILAIWKSGNYFAGAGDQYPRKSTLDFLNFLQIIYLVTDKDKNDYDGKLISVFQIREQTFFIWKRQPPEKEVQHCVFEDICYGIMTSGSTGEPKIIQVPWSCILPNAIELSHEFQVNDFDCIFQASPYSFDPFFIEFLMAFLNGCSLMIVSNSLKLDSSNLLRILFDTSEKNLPSSAFSFRHENFFMIELNQVKSKPVTILQITPSILKRWPDSEIQSFLLSHETTLRILILGGEKFPKEILGLKHPANKTKIFNIYGITEISCWAFLNQVTNCSPAADIALGKPLRNITYKISENDELLIGSSARICLVDKEYIFKTEETVFRSTGDIVKFSNGQLHYIGRSNQVVKKYGMKVSLSKIEDLIKSKNISLKQCYCVFDEESLLLGLFYVPTGNSEKIMDHNILSYEEFLNRNYEIPIGELKDVEKPDCFIEVTEIPVNCHGKCDRSRLLKELLDSYSAAKPELNIKSIFRKLWVRALGIRKSDLFSLGFTELGGNSVLALDIINGLDDAGFYVPQNFISHLLGGKNYSDCLTCLSLAAKKYGVPPKRFKADVTLSDVKLSLKWKFDLGKCVDAAPVIFTFRGEERIVIGSHSSQLSCLNPDSGFEIWTRHLGDRIESSFCPTEDGSKGFVGCYDHFVYCLSSGDGSIIWKFETEDIIKSTPCLSSDEKIVYVGSYDKHLYCLSTVNGHVEETLKLGNGSIYCSGVVSDILKSFYTGTLDGVCVAIHQETNRIIWKVVLGSPIFATPCLISNKTEILFSEVLGDVHCLSAVDGVKMWTFKADGNIYSSPIFQDSSIIFGCHDSHLYCLRNEKEPKLKWKQQLDSNVFARPAICSEATVCAVTTKGVIYLCDFAGGSVKSQLELKGEVFSSPVHCNNRLYFGCRDNNLYSVEINGSEALNESLSQTVKGVSESFGKAFDKQGKSSDCHGLSFGVKTEVQYK